MADAAAPGFFAALRMTVHNWKREKATTSQDDSVGKRIGHALSTVEQFADSSFEPAVRGFIHRPKASNAHCLILTHGAGGNCQAPLLVAVANVFAEVGFTVLRCNLPFRQTRPHGPPRPGDAERDRQGLKHAVLAMRKLGLERIFLGGHSYGGRQATILCAAEADLVNGLVLSSYPLHPPGKPAQLRVQHFPQLKRDALFLHGTRDPFGSIEEMKAALPLIPAKTRLIEVEGAGHDLGFKGKSQRDDLPGKALAEFQKLFFQSLSS